MTTQWNRYLCLLFAACMLAGLFCGCSGASPTPAAPTATVYETPSANPSLSPSPLPSPSPEPALEVVSAGVVADPPAFPDTVDDPYAQLDPNLIASMHPDRDQYNMLYRAVEAMKPKLDVSSFHMSRIRMNNVISYLDTNFRLFYLKNFKVSKNGKTATFTYIGTKEDIAREREKYLARLGHLIYDMAPEGYTDLQKFISVYESICEMANYSSSMSDQSTWSPYSIVMKGEGICWGYAMLTDYVLSRAGIPVRYVCNESHAWNVVQLGGKWYQTDVTWGAGNSWDIYNNLYTLLMDDATRIQSIRDAGYEPGEIIEGYHRPDAPSPPVCADASFVKAYRGIGSAYAFDIDHGKVFFSDDDGIAWMNLDGTGRELLAKDTHSFQMVCMDGCLYYVSLSDGYLYRMAPGGAPELLDGSAEVTNLKLNKTTLVYDTVSGEETTPKSLPLLALPDELKAGAADLPGAKAPSGRSFRLQIQFSAPLRAEPDWNNSIYLADADGNTIPLYVSLSSDGKTLTVRSKTCLWDAGHVTLYIKQGVNPANGAALAKSYKMEVTVG